MKRETAEVLKAQMKVKPNMLLWKEIEVKERSRSDTEQERRHEVTSHLYTMWYGNKRDENYLEIIWNHEGEVRASLCVTGRNGFI